MNEGAKFSNTFSDIDEDASPSVSVTIYEDESSLNYYNKSSPKLPMAKGSSETKQRILTASSCIRSPLSLISKNNQASGASSSHQLQRTKTPCKIDDSFVRRLQPKEYQPDPFNRISDEILLQIFSYLPKKALTRAALVNDRFSRVIQDDTLWVQLDLASKCIRAGAISTILCRGLVILRLAQAKIQVPIFEPDFIADGYQSKLQYLDLSMASIDCESLTQLLATCRHLVKLSLEAVPLDDSVCGEVANNRSLEVLNLAMCEGLTANGIALMMSSLQNLVALNISWTHLDSDDITAVVGGITPSIIRLNISGCRLSMFDRREFDDENFKQFFYYLTYLDLKALCSRCPNLAELDLSDCSKLTSESFNAIENLKQLEYLSLSRCYNIAMTSYQ